MKRKLGSIEDRKKVKVLLKECTEGWKKERLIALKMGFNSENTLDVIAESIGKDRQTIQRWFVKFRKEGVEGLLSRTYTGRPLKHSNDEIYDFLEKGLESGRWNTLVQAKQDLEKQFKCSFKYHNVWYWVKKCKGVIRIPRPSHTKRDPEKSKEFKRDFLQQLEQLPIARSKPVKVWFADESRYGLLPILRGCWTKKGLRQIKKYETKYEWSYCYGAIDPVDGECVFLQTPSVNMEWTEKFLLQVKQEFPDHEHVVVWDGAGFHPKEADHEMLPEGIHAIQLPPYSPELNPIEKLWDLIQDHTSNKLWPTIKRLDEVVGLLLEEWWKDPNRVLGLFGDNWHRDSANSSARTDIGILNLKRYKCFKNLSINKEHSLESLSIGKLKMKTNCKF